MKNIITAVFLISTLGCDDRELQKACVAKEVSDRACYEIYAPVCGCNNVTYPNDCYAISYGITQFTSGECTESK